MNEILKKYFNYAQKFALEFHHTGENQLNEKGNKEYSIIADQIQSALKLQELVNKRLKEDITSVRGWDEFYLLQSLVEESKLDEKDFEK